MHAVLCQRDPDRVTDTVREQAPDSDGALDPAVLAISGFRDAEVNGIVPIRPFRVQPRDEQTVRFDHHLWIARLHREDELVVVKVAGNAGKLVRSRPSRAVSP